MTSLVEFIEEFEKLRTNYFDKKLVKETLEECVKLIKEKSDNNSDNGSNSTDITPWYDWFRYECNFIVTGKLHEKLSLPTHPTRRLPSKEFMIGLLFVLNKLFSAWNLKQETNKSLLWEDFLDEVRLLFLFLLFLCLE